MSYAMQHFLTLRELQKAAFKALMAMPREASQELEAPTESGSDNKQNLEWVLMMLKVCFFIICVSFIFFPPVIAKHFF